MLYHLYWVMINNVAIWLKMVQERLYMVLLLGHGVLLLRLERHELY